MKLQDSIAIVTGASGGIGLAIAKRMAEQGATVVLAARSEEKLNQLASEIPNSFPVVTDMRKPEDIKRLISTVKDKYGKIDILVNNAGQGLMTSFENIPMDSYRDIMELNVFAVVDAMQQVIPIMRSQGGGTILNVSSMVSKNYYPGLSAYASTKYALNALSLTAREELKDDHIVVSVFHPKMTATDFGANAMGQKYDSKGSPGMQVDTAEEVAEKIVNQIESGTAEENM